MKKSQLFTLLNEYTEKYLWPRIEQYINTQLNITGQIREVKKPKFTKEQQLEITTKYKELMESQGVTFNSLNESKTLNFDSSVSQNFNPTAGHHILQNEAHILKNTSIEADNSIASMDTLQNLDKTEADESKKRAYRNLYNSINVGS